MVDVQKKALGSIFQQHIKGSWQPIEFCSMLLTAKQQNYSTYDRELLVAYSSTNHYQYLLKRCEFSCSRTTRSHSLFINRWKTSGRQTINISGVDP
ncbi:hypothetical protein CDAR_197991 [Caerostris darwini]|uniref:Reverse transcriptase RNase H-like domain-containing protein n=1 Tax=Caerostris darwini TaxID=1538125 RepID=A0AAV4RFC0_9ARAC|nr:hypothetical protein CDAR_197991 [Caerostris darwini]